MGKPHKDLPGGSQAWAAEVDALLEENKQLREVVRQLCANAGIDFANPKRGINTGDIPSVKNPVGQKLSSLADVRTYDVLDGQYLSWSQQGQRWLPVTLPTPTAGGTIDISEVSYSGLPEGYGTIQDSSNFAYTAAGIVGTAPFTYEYVENWSTGTVFFGAGNYNTGPLSMIELSKGTLGRPYVQFSASDFTSGEDAYAVLSSFNFRLQGAYFVAHRCVTADRPTSLDASNDDRGAMVFDMDLNIPIWWNGTTWTNALGTAV
jgi:hypothetical protein